MTYPADIASLAGYSEAKRQDLAASRAEGMEPSTKQIAASFPVGKHDPAADAADKHRDALHAWHQAAVMKRRADQAALDAEIALDLAKTKLDAAARAFNESIGV